ncbi:MAG: fluoride efflux transporter CrcB [Oscillospiraceae bacterium]|nr:fluoride efflux transporter CrcB [Oscillospiraceae bacterium]
MINLLIVAAGGALGAAGRYAVGLLPVKTDFPLLTQLVNAAGAVIIGFLAGLFARGGLTDRRLLFWKTGVCGGFTTFSAFSLEAVQLFEKGRHLAGSLYILLSLLLCLAGVLAGQALSRLFAK